MLGSSKPGIAGRLKRRRLSRAAKRRCPPGRRCRVDERPAFARVRSDPRRFADVHGGGTHLRSLRERTTLRGAMREPWTLAAAQRALVARRAARCAQNAREDPPPVAVCARRRGVRSRFEKGTRPPKSGTNLSSGRPGPAVVLLRAHDCAARQPVLSLAHARRQHQGEGVRRQVTSARSTRNRCGSWWCPCVVVLQKSAERPRAQRSARSVPNGSKARTVSEAREREPDLRRRSSAQARETIGRKRGAVHPSSAILIT